VLPHAIVLDMSYALKKEQAKARANLRRNSEFYVKETVNEKSEAAMAMEKKNYRKQPGSITNAKNAPMSFSISF
jgi:hypothetical protein